MTQQVSLTRRDEFDAFRQTFIDIRHRFMGWTRPQIDVGYSMFENDIEINGIRLSNYPCVFFELLEDAALFNMTIENAKLEAVDMTPEIEALPTVLAKVKIIDPSFFDHIQHADVPIGYWEIVGDTPQPKAYCDYMGFPDCFDASENLFYHDDTPAFHDIFTMTNAKFYCLPPFDDESGKIRYFVEDEARAIKLANKWGCQVADQRTK